MRNLHVVAMVAFAFAPFAHGQECRTYLNKAGKQQCAETTLKTPRDTAITNKKLQNEDTESVLNGLANRYQQESAGANVLKDQKAAESQRANSLARSCNTSECVQNVESLESRRDALPKDATEARRMLDTKARHEVIK